MSGWVDLKQIIFVSHMRRKEADGRVITLSPLTPAAQVQFPVRALPSSVDDSFFHPFGVGKSSTSIAGEERRVLRWSRPCVYDSPRPNRTSVLSGSKRRKDELLATGLSCLCANLFLIRDLIKKIFAVFGEWLSPLTAFINCQVFGINALYSYRFNTYVILAPYPFFASINHMVFMPALAHCNLLLAPMT